MEQLEHLCRCGCGKPTNIASYTHSGRGYVKGQPYPYLLNHGKRIANPSYKSLHHWLNANYVRTGKCEQCGKEGRTEFALIGEDYTRDRSDYLEACRRCHRAIDAKANGMVLTDSEIRCLLLLGKKAHLIAAGSNRIHRIAKEMAT